MQSAELSPAPDPVNAGLGPDGACQAQCRQPTTQLGVELLIVIPVVAEDLTLFQLVPMNAEISYQYFALPKMALVHDVVVTPVATET